MLEAISLLAQSQREVQPVNMKVTGPFTIACAVFGAERILLATIEEPEAVKRVMEKMAEVGIALSHAAIKAGVDTITISDPVASGDLLSGDQYAEFARPYEEKVFAALKDTPPKEFRTPPGLRMYRVNPSTGLPAAAGEPAIWEGYKPGTEPGKDRDRGLQPVPGETVAGAPATGPASGTACPRARPGR